MTAKKRKRHTKKIRTREHVIEDLSINYFERFALRCNYSLERIEKGDYGYDLLLFTYTDAGEIENGSVSIQMKASDKIVINKYNTIPFSADTRDLNLWRNEFDPVILVIYDAINERAYWLDIKEYFNGVNLSRQQRKQKTLTLYIPTSNRIGVRSLRTFAKEKNKNYDVKVYFS